MRVIRGTYAASNMVILQFILMIYLLYIEFTFASVKTKRAINSCKVYYDFTVDKRRIECELVGYR